MSMRIGAKWTAGSYSKLLRQGGRDEILTGSDPEDQLDSVEH